MPLELNRAGPLCVFVKTPRVFLGAASADNHRTEGHPANAPEAVGVTGI